MSYVTPISHENSLNNIFYKEEKTLAHYKLIKKLGEGEKGEVLLMETAGGNRIAVKKYFSKEMLGLQFPIEYIEAIFDRNDVCVLAEREWLLSQKLQHPNIVKAYEHFAEKDCEGKTLTYLTMEYIEGRRLCDLPVAHYSEAQAILMIQQCIKALKHACQQGYIHRDLNRDNILLDSQGNLMLIDIDSFEEIETGDSDSDSEDPETHYMYAKDFVHIFENILSSSSISLSNKEAICQNLLNTLFGQPDVNKPLTGDTVAAFLLPLFDQWSTMLKALSTDPTGPDAAIA